MRLVATPRKVHMLLFLSVGAQTACGKLWAGNGYDGLADEVTCEGCLHSLPYRRHAGDLRPNAHNNVSPISFGKVRRRTRRTRGRGH